VGTIKVELKLYKESLKPFQMALDLGYEDAGCNMCVALQKLSQFQEAIEPCRRCVKAGEQSSRLGRRLLFLLLLALILQIVIIILIIIVIFILVDSAWARVQAAGKWRNYGFLLRSLSRFEAAIHAFQRAEQLNPETKFTAEIADLQQSLAKSK
jgi:tetratricopeptide (TPR) repeat protein